MIKTSDHSTVTHSYSTNYSDLLDTTNENVKLSTLSGVATKITSLIFSITNPILIIGFPPDKFYNFSSTITDQQSRKFHLKSYEFCDVTTEPDIFSPLGSTSSNINFPMTSKD